MQKDSVRRIMAEVKEISRLNEQPQRLFHALPLDSDLFEWHFSVRGPPETAFEGGIYHGRMVLPSDYPLKPPEIILLTPNGRFEVGKRICLSVTSHHQETWQPSWGIRTILTALIGFMPSAAEGLGALDYPDEDRRRLARKSHSFKCDRCGMRPVEQLPPMTAVLGSGGGTTLGTPSTRHAHPRLSTAAPSSTASLSSSVPSSSLSSGINDKEPSSQSSVASSSTAANSSLKSNMTNEHETTTGGSASSDHTAPRASDAVVSNSSGRSRRQTGTRGEEKELLYMAYAIVAIMVAVIARRIVMTIAE